MSASLLSATGHELTRLVPLLDVLVGDLDAATARTRPAPGEWAPIEIVCHLMLRRSPPASPSRAL